jgi:putative pyoverdin transport system ATP-binding/permease protein
MYVYGQRIIRTKLAKLTSQIIYQKRVDLMNKILSTPYQSFSELEEGRIHASLNNDTEVFSSFANVLVMAATNVITLLFCFIYLGVMNGYGLLVSLGVTLLTALLYYFISQRANESFERARTLQGIFFRFINDLINGFKELSLNKARRSDFGQDMDTNMASYRDKRIDADVRFSNVFIIGELLFILVIGAVVFLFPIIFTDMKVSTLRNYIFVFLYMTGPVNGILESIPQLVQIKISWKRIKQLDKDLSSITKNSLENNNKDIKVTDTINLELKEVIYEHINAENQNFKVGPINYEFKGGEIVFITGGNGSGKSTLAKIITGLYQPDSGTITVNGKEVIREELTEYFSTVFSDFYLFKKLYGIERNKPENTKIIKSSLELLKLEDKVEVKNGEFSTTKLSTGQRKRLALLICYLENKPIYLFDEWAADQDPQFREYFYKYLLPQMKRQGKCVIAITHDDQYFDLADRVIKMDVGAIVEKKRQIS